MNLSIRGIERANRNKLFKSTGSLPFVNIHKFYHDHDIQIY